MLCCLGSVLLGVCVCVFVMGVVLWLGSVCDDRVVCVLCGAIGLCFWDVVVSWVVVLCFGNVCDDRVVCVCCGAVKLCVWMLWCWC